MFTMHFAIIFVHALVASTASATRYVYLGSNSSFILAYDLDWESPGSASLSYLSNISIANPQYTVLHPTLPVLYSIERGATYNPANWTVPTTSNNATALDGLFGATLTGGVAASSLDVSTRIPTSVLSRVPSLGVSPDFVGIISEVPVTAAFPQPADYSGRKHFYLAVTTYSTGTATVFKLDNETGAILWPPTSVFFLPAEEVGITTDNSRQGLPTAHHFVQRPGAPYPNKTVDVFVTNLGTDRVFEFNLNLSSGALVQKPQEFVATLGAGPRHVAFHPTNPKFAYIINEVGSTLTLFDSRNLTIIQEVSTTSGDFTGTNTAAEVVLHPNGKFLYASNRGEDTIAVFSIDPKTGVLTLASKILSGGAFPRYITLVNLSETPSGT
ncbi:hypothetical protein HDU83_002839, partial [Entophlyctis luteolus]